VTVRQGCGDLRLIFLQAYDHQGAATRLSDPDFFAALPAGAQQRQYNLGVGSCVQADHNVLENRHFAKELKVLVCPADTLPSPLVGTKSAHFCVVKHDLSRRWTKLTADKIEKSCFPGTIRTDYAANLSGRHANVNGVNGSEAAKPLRYVF
jgi:hypothetical protein